MNTLKAWLLLIIFLFTSSQSMAAIRVAKSLTFSYGTDPLQQLDVYLPAPKTNTKNLSPMVLMIHGGWKHGDKSARAIVKNKQQYCAQKGFIFISMNYRLLPNADLFAQRDDLINAIQFVQQHARDWGGNSKNLIVMGHSAGAHLLALVSAAPPPSLQPWRASIILDSAALDVPALMQAPHMKLYDPAFGQDPQTWLQLSPLQQLTRKAPPMLLVCSSKRKTACSEAQKFSARAQQLQRDSQVLPQDLSHREINKDLGADNSYTAAVDKFIASKLND
jgi:arylformamidase